MLDGVFEEEGLLRHVADAVVHAQHGPVVVVDQVVLAEQREDEARLASADRAHHCHQLACLNAELGDVQHPVVADRERRHALAERRLGHDGHARGVLAQRTRRVGTVLGHFQRHIRLEIRAFSPRYRHVLHLDGCERGGREQLLNPSRVRVEQSEILILLLERQHLFGALEDAQELPEGGDAVAHEEAHVEGQEVEGGEHREGRACLQSLAA